MTNNCNILKRLLKDEDNKKKYKQLTNSNAYNKYLPKSLSKDDKCKQLISIIKSKKRPYVKSFKSKKSSWTEKAKKYFKGDTSLDNIAKVLNVDKKGLQEIIDKGKAAYFTSGSRPNQSPESWSRARLYASLGLDSKSRKIDSHIIKKYKIPAIDYKNNKLVKGGSIEEPKIDDILSKKSFYSKELDDILSLVSFNKKNVEVLGSFQLRSQYYFSDIDLFENNIRLPINKIVDEFKKKIKKMLDDDTYYIGDIKSGVAEHLRVISDDIYINNNKIYNYNQKEILYKLNKLKQYLPDFNNLKKLLVKEPNEEQLNKIKKNFRFHIVRWTPVEILQGYKYLLDGSKYKFIDAVKSPALYKLDFFKYMNNSNFLEFSIIYDLRNSKGEKLNNVSYDTKDTLKNDIKKYMTEGQYFKVLKRKFSLLRYEYAYEKKNNKAKLIVLSKVLNSNLGNLYQVKAIIENLLFLIENFNNLNKDRINKSVDDLINKLSYVSLKQFVKKEEAIIDELKMMLNGKSVGNISKNLENIYNTIENIINTEAKKYIKFN